MRNVGGGATLFQSNGFALELELEQENPAGPGGDAAAYSLRGSALSRDPYLKSETLEGHVTNDTLFLRIQWNAESTGEYHGQFFNPPGESEARPSGVTFDVKKPEKPGVLVHRPELSALVRPRPW